MKKTLLTIFSIIVFGEALAERSVRNGLDGTSIEGSLRRRIEIRQAGLRQRGLQTLDSDGTNQYIRTRSEPSANYHDAQKRRMFDRNYPGGVDDFGRTYEEKTEFDAQFDIMEFLGYTFASPLSEKRTDKMSAPFRLFEEATLEPTVKGRLGSIIIDRETKDMSHGDIKAETLKLAALLECAYGITFSRRYKTTNHGDEGRLCETGTYKFENDNLTIKVQDEYEPSTGKGWFGVTISKKGLIEADRADRDRELAKIVEKTQKPVNVSFSKDIERLPTSVRLETAVKILSAEFEKDPSVSLGRLRYLTGKTLRENDSQPR